MTTQDLQRLADDGCPHCPEHVAVACRLDARPVVFHINGKPLPMRMEVVDRDGERYIIGTEP